MPHFSNSNLSNQKITVSFDTVIYISSKVSMLFGVMLGALQAAEGFGFDIADTLTGDANHCGDLLQGVGAAVCEPEAQLQYLSFSGSDHIQKIGELCLQLIHIAVVFTMGHVGGFFQGDFDAAVEDPCKLLHG